MRSSFNKYIALIFVAGFFASCADKNHRNYQYFPDMYRPVSYETYGEYDIFQDNQEAKLPVEGTIKRGWKPYPYEDTPEGKAAAKANLKNPLPYTEKNLEKGKELYGIYCAICHGDKGDGQGTLAQREKILGIPSYDDAGRAINEGDVYHTMYYGLNNMGSYAVQTDEKERWQIDHYVMSLKDKLEGKEPRAFEKETGEGQEDMKSSEASTKVTAQSQDKGSKDQQEESTNKE